MKVASCIALILFYFSSTGLWAEEQQNQDTLPNWIENQHENDDISSNSDYPDMNDFAYNLFSAQANSGDTQLQLNAIQGIQELLQQQTILRSNPHALEVLYKIAGQAFLRYENPPVYPFYAQIAAVQQLSEMGPAAHSKLLAILRNEPNPSIAAEAADALPNVGFSNQGQAILTHRLRRNRSYEKDPGFGRALLLLALREANYYILEENLLEEIMEYAFGNGTGNERRLAAEILALVSE